MHTSQLEPVLVQGVRLAEKLLPAALLLPDSGTPAAHAGYLLQTCIPGTAHLASELFDIAAASPIA